MPLILDAERTTAPKISQQEIKRTIFAIVWPVAIENILQLLIGFVNIAMVGRLGAAVILAVGLAGRVGMFVWIVFGAIGTGTTVLTARALGAKDGDAIRKIAVQGLAATICLIGIVTGVVFIYAPGFMELLNATPESFEYGVKYLRLWAFNIPFQALFMVMSAVLRGTGDTRTPMQIAFVINIVNATLSALLIFGKLGFPEIGFKGPAIGTIIGQATGAGIALWFLARPKSGVGLRLDSKFSLDMPLIRKLLGIGIPASGEMFFWQIAGIILFRLVNEFGTLAGAAYQLGLQAEGISYMPAAGFGIAATALVGRSLGAGDSRLAERYVKQLVHWGVALTTGTTAILVLGPKVLMRILTDDPAVIVLGAEYVLIMGLSQIPQQVSGTLGGSLRGAGDTVTPMVAAALGIWGCRIPVAFILSRRFGLPGIWWAINLDQYVRLLVVGWRYKTGRWKTGLKETLLENNLSPG